MTDSLVTQSLQFNEIQLMKVCQAIRVLVGFSKKVVFKLMRAMKNGALWIKYSVDGINCSTFAKALKLASAMNTASISEIALNWFTDKANQMGLIASVGYGDVAAKANIEGKTFYVTVSNDFYNLYANNRMVTPRTRAKDAASMVAFILKNWKTIN